MNKASIKNFAIWARRKLISDITYRAGMLGITENGIAQPMPQSTKDLQFFDIGTKDYVEISGDEIQQRNALLSVIQNKGRSSDYKTAFRSVVEEVAYTWFNRLIAVRFMEVNDYLPSKVRVLSSENPNKLEPDFVTNPFDTDLNFTPYEKDVVLQLKEQNKLDELFRMLFIKECNRLCPILPELFEQISDYTELLLTISFADKDGVVYHLTHDIGEDDFNVEKEGQVEIIGWLYQYYNTEPKDEVFALLKKNVKITKERIPAATQLFTPDWIVRYMVENSLGRLWVEGHPNEDLKKTWKYYLEEAEQEPEVQVQLAKIREEYAKINPEDIKLIDPCMGSGHILVYAFDVLMQIYTSYGYTQRDAAKSILEKNLYGIDIDTRAYQLAYFAVMMKARQYNRRIFNENIYPNLMAVKNPAPCSNSCLRRLGDMEKLGIRLINDFRDAEEYGSILQLNYTQEELDALDKRLNEIDEMADYGNLLVQMESIELVNALSPLVRQARIMTQKYDVVVTNPPYMGASGMSGKLSEFVKKYYPDSKSDMSTVCMEKSVSMCNKSGYMAMINIPVWMFLSSYEKLRFKLYAGSTIINMVHPGRGIFGSDFGTTTFVFRKGIIKNYLGSYRRLFDKQGEVETNDEREKALLSGKGKYTAMQENFEKIPGSPVAYWISKQILKDYSIGRRLDSVAQPKQGIKTADKDRFLRFWYEVSHAKISITNKKHPKWFPCNKGGDFRKWYGNNEYVVNWENNGYEICNYRDETGKLKSRPQNLQFMLREGITYTNISISSFGARYSPEGYIYDAAGSGIFCSTKDIPYVLAFLTSVVAATITKITSPTLSFEVGQIGSLPFIHVPSSEIDKAVADSINLSRDDWDSFETSWDFKRHPLI